MAEGAIASEQLRLFVERVERLTEEKKNIADDIRDVFLEAKSQGFDTKTIKEIIKLRAMDPHERREREALLDTYKAALGMLDGTPLGRWALERLDKDEADAEIASPEIDLDDAIAYVVSSQNASVSALQRHFKIAYNPAARLIEQMEAVGIVSAPDSAGRRTVLRQPDGSEAPVEPPAPEPTVDDARHMGADAAAAGAPVTSNPFPARDPRRAAWDEAWCAALGSDGMEIPDALKPKPKPKKGKAADGASDDGGAE